MRFVLCGDLSFRGRHPAIRSKCNAFRVRASRRAFLSSRHSAYSLQWRGVLRRSKCNRLPRCACGCQTPKSVPQKHADVLQSNSFGQKPILLRWHLKHAAFERFITVRIARIGPASAGFCLTCGPLFEAQLLRFGFDKLGQGLTEFDMRLLTEVNAVDFVDRDDLASIEEGHFTALCQFF